MRSTTVISEQGAGRGFAVLFEQGSIYQTLARAVHEALVESAKVYLIETPALGSENWKTCGEEFLRILTEKQVRQLSIITFGATSVVAHNTYLHNAKLVRSLLIVDGTTSPHPSKWERLIDWLEERFPLGLPLRGKTKNFNVRAHLQRVRCPVLQMTTGRSDELIQTQSEAAVAAMPTAWLMKTTKQVDSVEECQELIDCVHEFQLIPAKCPQ